ncbi:hypothetical protein EDD86DRAFT_265935 [Gorgonomyces haynaldii]|nr:hypothetical protein EDD86DRAFT_265935 [Gorgonomyces haynaldii]
MLYSKLTTALSLLVIFATIVLSFTMTPYWCVISTFLIAGLVLCKYRNRMGSLFQATILFVSSIAGLAGSYIWGNILDRLLNLCQQLTGLTRSHCETSTGATPLMAILNFALCVTLTLFSLAGGLTAVKMYFEVLLKERKRRHRKQAAFIAKVLAEMDPDHKSESTNTASEAYYPADDSTEDAEQPYVVYDRNGAKYYPALSDQQRSLYSLPRKAPGSSYFDHYSSTSDALDRSNSQTTTSEYAEPVGQATVRALE